MVTATLIIMDHKSLTENIKNILGETVGGDFSDTLPMESLLSDSSKIDPNLKTLETFPFEIKNTNLHEILTLTTVKAKLKNVTLIIELSIPIVEKQVYSKTTPIPIFRNDVMYIVVTTQNYLLVDMSSEEIIELPNTDIKIGCNNTVKRRYIEKQSILELGRVCTEQIGKLKLKQPTFGYKDSKFYGNLKHFDWPDTIETSLTMDEPLIVADSEDRTRIMDEMDDMRVQHRSMVRLDKIEQTDEFSI